VNILGVSEEPWTERINYTRKLAYLEVLPDLLVNNPAVPGGNLIMLYFVLKPVKIKKYFIQYCFICRPSDPLCRRMLGLFPGPFPIGSQPL
jgi:hypothetical protein